MSEIVPVKWASRGKAIVLTRPIKRKIDGWKSRIYRRYNTLREFIEPLGIKESRFSAWMHGRNLPSIEFYEKIERALTDLGV